MSEFSKTTRSEIQRLPDRGHYDRRTIYAILDEAFFCHVGFIDGGEPVVIPTIHVRIDDTLYIHGAPNSRMLTCAGQGTAVSIAVTLLDGLVLARSAFHHSMNYRSVVLFAKGREVTDGREKDRVLEALVDSIVPGRWRDARQPNTAERNGTAVVGFDIDEASAKVRSGPPGDNDEDYALPVWAGVLPLEMQFGSPQPDPKLSPGIEIPDYIHKLCSNSDYP